MRLLVIIFFLLSTIAYGQVKSKEVVYYKCAKWVSFDSVGFNDLSFTVTGADTVISPPSIILIPHDSTVKLIVKKDKRIYKEFNYKVIAIPLPTIEIWVNGKYITDNTGSISINSRNITLKAIPNADLVKIMPRECRYRVLEFEIEIFRDNKTIEKKSSNEKEQWNLNFKFIKSNDILVYRITKIARTNFRNEKEEIKVNKKITLRVI